MADGDMMVRAALGLDPAPRTAAARARVRWEEVSQAMRLILPRLQTTVEDTRPALNDRQTPDDLRAELFCLETIYLIVRAMAHAQTPREAMTEIEDLDGQLEDGL